MFEESLALFRELGDTGRAGDALDRLAGARVAAGKLQEAKAAAEEGLALFEQRGEREGSMYILDKVALIAREEGDDEEARTTLERALAIAREFDDSWWATRTMVRLALWSFDDGELARAEELTREGHDAATVQRVWRLLEGAEYKRRQAPPGVKLRPKAFGRDRRTPITNRWPG